MYSVVTTLLIIFMLLSGSATTANGDTLSPYELYVMQNWLADDTRGDLNGDGITNMTDFAIATQRNVGSVVIWGRTPEIALESLNVAYHEALFENNQLLAASYLEAIQTWSL